MKHILLLGIFLGSIICTGQKTFATLGYTMATTSWNKAYYPHYSYHSIPNDLSQADFARDRMFFGNWHVKMGLIDEGAYFDSDLSWLGQTFVTSLYEWAANRNVKPNHQVGVGRLRKLQKNFENFAVNNDSMEAFAIDANMWSMELAFGKKFLVGGYFGTSGLGIDDGDLNYANTGGTTSVGFAPNSYIYGQLGLGFHYALMEDDYNALISLRANRLRVWKSSTEGEYKRTGLEIYPSLRVWIGETAGLYLDMSYRYRMFFDKQVVDYWSDQADGTIEGTLPGFSSHQLSLTLGLFIPYWNLD